jgi:hypothetical protein
MKKCTNCCIEKPFSEFYKRGDGYKSHCKVCVRKYYESYYEKNKKEHSSKMKEHYKKNIDNYKYNHSNYRELNVEKIKKINREFISNKRNKDPIFRLISNLRSRTYSFFKVKKISKKNTTKDLLGCSPEQLKEHIENLFTEGMSWDLLGKRIEIDHIIPLSSAKSEEDVYKLCNYRNLQPMWAEDNRKKSNKI